MRFENRALEEWLEDRVITHFIGDMAAAEVVPVCSGTSFIDVAVEWPDGKRWLVRCFSALERMQRIPGISGMVDMCRVAMVLKARPLIAFVHGDRIEMVWSREGGETPSMERAA